MVNGPARRTTLGLGLVSRAFQSASAISRASVALATLRTVNPPPPSGSAPTSVSGPDALRRSGAGDEVRSQPVPDCLGNDLGREVFGVALSALLGKPLLAAAGDVVVDVGDSRISDDGPAGGDLDQVVIGDDRRDLRIRRAGEPAVADYVSRENGSEFTSPRTAVPLPQRRVARLIALRRAKRRRCETGLLAVCDRL